MHIQKPTIINPPSAPKEIQLFKPAQGWKRKFPKIGRNDSCPCGSGKKFKKCCLNKS